MIVVAVALTGFGCRGRVSEGELPGRYRTAYDDAVEQLTLRGDRTYVQESGKPGQPLAAINEGRWSIQAGDFWDGTIVLLHDPVVFDDGFGRHRGAAGKARNGVWSLPARRSVFGATRLIINEDVGQWFEKIER